jgi:hypothetical protein
MDGATQLWLGFKIKGSKDSRPQTDSVKESNNNFIDTRSNVQDVVNKRGRPSLKQFKIDFEQVKKDYEKLKSLRKVARLYGISRTSVLNIVKGRVGRDGS